MDLASEATAAWLEMRTGIARETRPPGQLQIPSEVRVALTQVVHTGLEAAVRDVVARDQQSTVLRILTRDAGAGSVTEIGRDTALPDVVVQHISPRLDALEAQGLRVDRGELASQLRAHINATIRSEIHPSLPGPFFAMLAGLPGTTFGDDEDEDENDDGNDSTAQGD